MSKFDDKQASDGELKAYLDGRDGISAAYRQTGEEAPPPALDAFILKAAREAVQGDVEQGKGAGGNKKAMWGKYQLAASFMVGVLVTSLYFERANELDMTLVPASSVQEQSGPAMQNAPAPAVADSVISANPGLASSVAAPVIGEEESARSATPTLQAPIASVTQSGAALTTALRAARQGQNLEAEQALAGNAAEALAAKAVQEPAGQADAITGTELAEITVTGASIPANGERDISYRETQEVWLAEILALGGEVPALAADLEEATTRLEEEKALFSDAFPDVNLDEVLAPAAPQ